MVQTKTQTPLSNVQVELLKLYASGLPDKYLDDIKILIAKYLFARARAKADAIWDKNGYTDEIIQELLKRQS